ncbi:hypothetical protein [Pararhodobacter sp.]|uniref:hypothetical protein n=1 Tax=Pararhodobacter sp. TaxID=2127056 RepID=UPI002FDD8BED
MRLLPLLCLTALFPAVAAADEMWSTPYGYVAWEDTRGDMAIFRMMGDDGLTPGTMRLFVPGLPADTEQGRSVYFGYWTDPAADAPCAFDVIDAMGNKSPSWGRLTLSFLSGGFPSDWAGLTGYCFDEPTMPINATPAYGIGD